MRRRYRRNYEQDPIKSITNLVDACVGAYKIGGAPLFCGIIGLVLFSVAFIFKIVLGSLAFWIILLLGLSLILLSIFLFLRQKGFFVGKCPKCGTKLVVKNKNGKFLVCPKYPECKFTKNL